MTFAEKLAEAEEAFHALMTGKAASVYVDQNGERVEYTRGSAADLRSYIGELKILVGKARGSEQTINFNINKGLT